MEYLIGNVFGMSQIIIGYPLDTIKTHIQNNKPLTIFKNNPKLLYAGIKYPLIQNSIGSGILFGNYDFFCNHVDHEIAAGVLTGITSALFITPFDFRKVNAQYYGNNFKMPFNRTLKQRIKLYYGAVHYTTAREILSIPAYFSTFHYLNEKFKKDSLESMYSNEITLKKLYSNSFVAGGIAGVNSWLISYPFDILKTRKQLYTEKTLKELIKMGGLYNGLGITLIRGFIVNGFSFHLYEIINNLFTI